MQVDNILKAVPAVLWVSPAMTIGEVAERLRSTDVGAMIVSNDGEALHGLISERDIAQGLAVHGAALLSLKVQDLMTRSVIVFAEDSTADIARIMTMPHPAYSRGRERKGRPRRRRVATC
ncbi:MAG: CBS domain-containing protein [Xanthobacteraceae bacterium]